MKIICIDGYNSYLAKNFYNKYKKKYKIFIFKSDINNIKNLKTFIDKKKISIYIRFAALSRSKCENNLIQCYSTNFTANKKLVNLLKFKKIKLLFMSSSHVYSYSNIRISEKSDIKPHNNYGKFKLKTENYIKKNIDDYLIMRIFNIYGKNQPPSFFIPDMISKIKNNEEITINKSIRDFIHVDEVSKIINFSIKKKILGMINVGSGRGLTLKYIVKKIGKYIGIKPRLTENNFSDKIVANISLLNSYGYKQNKNAKYFNI
tara:strand:+ start:407 stop:1189 length:783 start_codon:yes stop_codon:yes gene_type:complete